MKTKNKIKIIGLLTFLIGIMLYINKSFTGFIVSNGIISSYATIIPIAIFLIGSLIYADAEQISKVINARKLVTKIGERLYREHPELADSYRRGDNLTRYLDIAIEYLGSEAEDFPNVCSKALGYAIRELIPRAELNEINKRRAGARLENRFGGFDSIKFKNHCIRARRIKEEKGIKTPVELLTIGRGFVPYTAEEREMLDELLKNPDYQKKDGQHKGRPDYDLIALELNILFHDCKEVRDSRRIGNYARDQKRLRKLGGTRKNNARKAD